MVQTSRFKIKNIPENPHKGLLRIESGRTLRAHEVETIERLLRFGYDIVCNQESNLPYTKVADIVWRNELWEMKYLTGDSKHNIANNLRKAKKQSQNIVLDISSAKREIENAIPQVTDKMHNSKKIRKVLIVSKNRYCLIERNLI